MDIEEFRVHGKEMIDIICDYYANVNKLPPMSKVKPGYLFKLLPRQAPETPESFDEIQQDMRTKIMPGITHWQSGNFFGWFPASTSFPSIIADMYSDMFNAIGFNWICSPAMTELETVVMDWLGKLVGLDERFLSFKEDGTAAAGGGVIHGNASEAMLVAMIAGREKMLWHIAANDASSSGSHDKRALSTRLVAYFSDQTHLSGQKGASIIGCRVRIIASDPSFRLTKAALSKAVSSDRDKGLIPFFVCGTFGTTNTAAIDDLEGIADVAESERLWFHVDAAYAGCALVCPEFQPLNKGVERADSFNFNPHKWMLINFDCSTTWFADSTHVEAALSIQKEYLPRVKTSSTLFVRDYRNWQVFFGRRFRSLKLWFVMRMYGASGIRAYIRQHVEQTKWLEARLRADGRFEIMAPVTFALVVFRISPHAVENSCGKEATPAMVNHANLTLIREIQADNRVFLVGTTIKGLEVLRASPGSTFAKQENVELLFSVVEETTTSVLSGL